MSAIWDVARLGSSCMIQSLSLPTLAEIEGLEPLNLTK